MAGLRERKKRETAERIASVAAGLFARRGFEDVAVLDVARVADVSEQTVYNHFPTKEDLVFDRSAEIEAALAGAVADRPPGISALDAVAGVAHALIDRTATTPLDQSRGGMPRLSAVSPTLGRAGLERTRRQADRLAGVLASQGEGDTEALIVAWSIVGVFQIMIETLGRAQQAGEDPVLTAERLGTLVDRQIERLRGLEV